MSGEFLSKGARLEFFKGAYRVGAHALKSDEKLEEDDYTLFHALRFVHSTATDVIQYDSENHVVAEFSIEYIDAANDDYDVVFTEY